MDSRTNTRTTPQDAGAASMTGAELIGALVKHLRRYVVFSSDHQPLALAFWIIHTHAFTVADATPYPLVTSPEKRSGKSRLLEVLEHLVCSGWRVAGVSEAVLFRKIEKDTPTLLFDELDAVFGTYAEKTEPIRAVINAGNRRGGSVARCVGREHDVEDFAVFCPKCLAGIDTGRLPETIRDRSITIHLHRKVASETVERFRYREARPLADALVASVKAWVDGHLDELALLEPEIPDQLNDRAAEGWEPLLAIGELIGPDMASQLRDAAIALSGQVEIEDESFGLQLLADLRVVWENPEAQETLPSMHICIALKQMEERPWGAWGKGRSNPGISPRDLARLLRPFGVRPRTVRLGGITAKGYKREQFVELWERYTPAMPDEEVA